MTVCHPVIKKKKFRKPLEHMLRVYDMYLCCIVENFEMCGKFHYSPTLERRPWKHFSDLNGVHWIATDAGGNFWLSIHHFYKKVWEDSANSTFLGSQDTLDVSHSLTESLIVSRLYWCVPGVSLVNYRRLYWCDSDGWGYWWLWWPWWPWCPVTRMTQMTLMTMKKVI